MTWNTVLTYSVLGINPGAFSKLDEYPSTYVAPPARSSLPQHTFFFVCLFYFILSSEKFRLSPTSQMNKLRLEVAKVAELGSQPRGVSWILKWGLKDLPWGLGCI